MFFTLPWYIPRTESFKLKSCRNLIEHYLGDFLEKIALDQLSVNLYNGTGTVSDVTLDCDALNKLGSDRNWPLEVVKAHMKDISVAVPWTNVFKDNSMLKVDGLSLTLQPKVRAEPVKMFFTLPWYIPRTESFKLKSCRNLIEHYLGDFLEKIALDQLSVNLYNGTGTVSDVTLDCDALNKLGSDRNWPLEVVKAHMKDISVAVPWTNVFKDNSMLKVDGLSLTLQPKVRAEPAKSVFKWMMVNWPKLSPKQVFALNKKADGFQKYTEEEKMFAENIEAIIKRLKVKMENTKIRIEHLPKHINRGFALEFYIKSIDCQDEDMSDFSPGESDFQRSKPYVLDTYMKKKIKIAGVTLFTDEFYVKQNSRETHCNNFKASQRYNIDYSLDRHASGCIFRRMNNDIRETKPHIVKNISERQSSGDIKIDKSNPLGPIMFAILNGQQELTLSVTKSGKMEGVSFKAETIGPLEIRLSLNQLDVVIDLLKSLKLTQPQENRKNNDALDVLNNIMCCVD